MDLTYSYLLQTFRQFTWTSAFLSAATLFIGSVFAVREIFKPLHHKKPIKGKRWKLPPGPAGVPFFGNVLQFQRARRDEVDFGKYLSSLASFGEMATLHMGSKTWVLLNSNRVVDELISKRGSVTHERPYMPVALGLVSRGNRFFLQETKRWADARRVLHHLLTGSAVKSCGQLQELESVQLLAAYLHRPREWYSHHYRYSVSLMHQIILGERLLRSTGELDHLRGIIGGFIQCINGNMIDFFPQLAALPKVLQPWRKRYESMGQIHWEGFRTWWEPLKQSVAEGTAMPSLARDVLLCKDTKYPGGDDDAMYLAMSTISAGSDNPRMAMNVFVMAALSYPEPFGKARAELDRVCGHDANRLPDVVDMTSLPYLCALVKEVIRWRPSVPMIPQHQSVQDLEFEGYLFPAGTEFIINGVAAGQDFPDAESFSPERWLDGGNESKVSHGLWHFGGGRRICVGYKIAQTELFLAFSRLIYCFDFAAAGPYDNLRLRHYHTGEPFPVEIKVRSPDHEQLINNQAERFGVLESAKAKF
ncbi:MAG: hypothetical protein LQ339_001726 [Xanthoria mediterranea]|nr:MAG: hypothetical protein LQ339_001726 [Xanthoria mediterranea]